nr:hypothetical protein [Tanacetum cinerariifolium]
MNSQHRSASNPVKVKTGTRPRAAHKVPLLTDTTRRVIDMEDTVVAGEEATTEVIPESSLEKEVAAMGPVVNKRRRKRRNEGAGANAPPKVLRKDYAASHPAQSTRGEKSIVIIGLNAGSTLSMPTTQDVPTAAKSVNDPDPMSYVKPQPHPERDISQSSKEMAIEVPTRHVATTKVQGGISAKSQESVKSTPFLSVDGSPEGIYQPGWGVTNNYRLDTPDTYQDMVEHVVPPGYFSELRHLPNIDILSHYNMNLAQQRIKAREEEIKKLDHEIKSLRTMEMELHGLRNQTKNLETLLEAEAQVTGEERIKAAFEEFTKYEDDRVNSCCAEIDARFDALSIDFDKELYPHMPTAIAGRRWVIGAWSTSSCYESSKLRQVFADVISVGVTKGMSEGLKHGIEHGKANLDLAAIEAYNPEADAKYVTALQALKDLKYPLIRELRPSSSRLKILVYLEVRDPKDPWSFKEETLLEDAISANISRVKKKKKCRVVCRTHGVGSAHHARSNGIPVSVPTVALKVLPSCCRMLLYRQGYLKMNHLRGCLDPSPYRLCIIWIGHNTVCVQIHTTVGVDVNAASVQDTPITAAEATKVSVPRKRRGVIIQDPEETTTTLDEEVARQLEAELNADINWNTMIEKVKRSERLTDVVMKYQSLKRKPLTEAQARRNMIVYLKNMAGYKMDYFKGMSYDEIRPLFEKHYNYNQAFLNEIVLDDDGDVYTDATPLASKLPIIDYKIHTERNRPYFKIIKADRNHRLFLSFSTMLKNFNREDLESLWNIVKERFAKTQPNNYSDDFLLNTLKIMFEKPNVEANVWKDQKGKYGLAKVKRWKLFESCGVHCLTLLTTQIFLLVERMYPLTHFTLEKMINDVRLEVEDESEMSLELLRLVKR